MQDRAVVPSVDGPDPSEFGDGWMAYSQPRNLEKDRYVR